MPNRSQKQREDPTNQARNRNRANKEFMRRLKIANNEALRLFRAIPRKRTQKKDIQNILASVSDPDLFINTFDCIPGLYAKTEDRKRIMYVNQGTTITYEYEISADELAAMGVAIQTVFDRELMTFAHPATVQQWFWTEHITTPYIQGTAQEASMLTRLIKDAQAKNLLVDLPSLLRPTLSIETIVLTPEYREAVRKQVLSNINHIKTLSDTSAQRAFTAISQGIDGGLTPSMISDTIQARFRGATASNARRIATTEINKSFNNAHMRLSKQAFDEFGLKTGVVHISALISTTRRGHAARHGFVYTLEAELLWWDSGTNRINCLCTTVTVLLGKDGKPVDKDLLAQLQAEREFFKKAA